MHVDACLLQSKGYQIDFDDWHAHAHGVLPYELVTPDPALRKVGLFNQSAAQQPDFCDFSLPPNIGQQGPTDAYLCGIPSVSAQLNQYRQSVCRCCKRCRCPSGCSQMRT